ncbi:MAG TPA: HD domain-containing protein [Firmicutes bacterium]|jgi:metal-dependent HD superfamily phosphatase/phosphodiesterase|nr:HD domain-containing protein [Bacillota bacterium]
MITLADIQSDPDFRTLIERSGASLKGRGYTEHGLRHVTYVAEKAAQILTELGFDDRTVELAAIAGYLHDVGNLFNRKDHGIAGAALVYQELRRKGMDLDEICTITGAIGNHEESNGRAVSPVSAALILADKSDAHRTRANRREDDRRPGVHHRVNLAITDSRLYVDRESKTITLEISFDQTICQIMDYFEIYLTRMEMCKQASTLLGCRFRLIINNLEFLGNLDLRQC